MAEQIDTTIQGKLSAPRANSKALLIGCDYYFQGDGSPGTVKFSHLFGAIRDVELIKTFLIKIGVPKDNITTLTASYDPHSPSSPTESDKSKWPTHENIIRALEHITEHSEWGELVYIQFSGHGIQRANAPPEKMTPGGDALFGAALATTNVMEADGKYLTGTELGLRIQAMVKIGLRVTLVLDACFSGRGLRNDDSFSPRTILDYQDGRNLDKDEASENKAAEYLTKVSGTRQSVMRENWLSKPTGCTVLTACGMQQTAGESFFEDVVTKAKKKEGLLTHWMLEILSKYQSTMPSYTAVKDYVVQKIKANSPQANQVPVLSGDEEYEFFGAEKHIRRPACRVIDVWASRVHLDIGSAQGVAQNAVYDIYPVDVDYENVKSFGMARQARVVEVDDFYCEALLVDKTKLPDGHKIAVGSSGVLRNWALRDEVSVKFTPEDTELKKAFESEIQKTFNFVLHDGPDGAETFKITLRNDNFEIFERGTKLQRLPVINVHNELAVPRLAYILRHVSRYRDVQGIEDLPRSTHIQQEKFEMQIFRDDDKLGATNDTIEVIAGERLGYKLKYSGRCPFICVSIFELNPSWGVILRRTVKLVKNQAEPKGRPLGFRTTIPPKTAPDDSDDTSDIFMAFMVEGEDEQSWDELMLDELPTDAQNLPLYSEKEVPSDRKRADFEPPTELPSRRWGVASFVVHSLAATRDE